MKKIAFVFAFLLTISFQLNAQWYWQNPLPQGNTLYSVWVANSQKVITVGENGTLLITEDAGSNWQQKNHLLNSSSALKGLQFIDSNTGWCIDNNNLYKTTNGGNDWILGYSRQDNVLLNSVYFIDETNGWMACKDRVLFTKDGGFSWYDTALPWNDYTSIFFTDINFGWTTNINGMIYRTTDGGDNWELVENSGLNSYEDVFFLNKSKGWVVGSAWQFGSILLSTNDGGITWTEHSTPQSFSGLSCVIFTDSSNGFVTGNVNHLYRTTDGGITWTSVANSFGVLYSVHSSNDGNIIWAVGKQGTLIASTSAGNTWEMKSQHLANSFYDIKFFNSSIGWVAGDKVLKTKDGGNHWVIQNLPFPDFIRSIFLYDSLTIWSAGQYIFKTTNGGQS